MEAVIKSDLLNKIAYKLGSFTAQDDWKRLGFALEIDEQTCCQFGTPSTNSTRLLFDFLEVNRPNMTVGEFRNVLKEMKREDVLKTLKDFRLEGNITVTIKHRLSELISFRS